LFLASSLCPRKNMMRANWPSAHHNSMNWILSERKRTAKDS